jgi:hypothetical protein
MDDQLLTALFAQLAACRDEYLSLRQEIEWTKRCIVYHAEMLRLLQKSLALDGVRVKLPVELN